MNVSRTSLLPRLLLASGLVLAGSAAQAAGFGGYTVTQREESQIVPGMAQADVLLALGRPAHNVQYRNEPGPTLTYHVVSAEGLLFDIQFDAQGKVLSTVEHADETLGGP